MTTDDTVRAVIGTVSAVLQLGANAGHLGARSPLLGAIPEFDSMAVVSVITALEERFGFVVDDDEIDAETFQTIGTLAAFVDRKLAG